MTTDVIARIIKTETYLVETEDIDVDYFDEVIEVLVAARDEIERLRKHRDDHMSTLRSAYMALRGYQYHNGAPDLAKEIADIIVKRFPDIKEAWEP